MFRINTLLSLVILIIFVTLAVPQTPAQAGGGGAKSSGCAALNANLAGIVTAYNAAGTFWAGEEITVTNASVGGLNMVFTLVGDSTYRISGSGTWTFSVTIPANGTYELVLSSPMDFRGGTIQCSAAVIPPAASAPTVSAPVPGPDMIAIPTQAVMGTFLTDTPLYASPSLDDVTPFTMQAGKSLWVFGLSEDGAFYQVVLAGKKLWVPVDTLGPTAVSPWSSQPLPTTIVS